MDEFLGIELGSTRIKAVVIDGTGATVASGSFAWENRPLADDVWTYELADARKGVAAAYAACADAYAAARGARPTSFAAIGISAMMHGYVVFDKAMNQLAPFRTWRSTNATKAGAELSAAFGFHVPARWSVSQLFQSVLDGEAHVKDIAFQTTLAGYVHFLLTGRKVLGVDDASGMFPIDSATKTYDARMAKTFRERTGVDVNAVFPQVLVAGADAGVLTDAGAKLLDPTGTLKSGIPLCPPEGDAGTGMIATNAVRPRTGNVSAGTSVFSMTVLERPLSKPYPEIDVVSTPGGSDVAMVHCNNGCGELDKWVALFGGDYDALFNEALEKGAPDCGGVRATNWISAEPLAGVSAPDPYVTHLPGADLTRANLLRAQLYAVFATLRVGTEILAREGVRTDRLTGHGGLFSTPRVAQQILADALNVSVGCLSTASAGGAWGIAVLAAYRAAVLRGETRTLEDWLDATVFTSAAGSVLDPDPKGVAGFAAFAASGE